MMELEANIFDFEGELLDTYFYATQDIEYVLTESMERADSEGLQYYDIVVCPFDSYDEYRDDPLGRYCPSDGIYYAKEEEY